MTIRATEVEVERLTACEMLRDASMGIGVCTPRLAKAIAGAASFPNWRGEGRQISSSEACKKRHGNDRFIKPAAETGSVLGMVDS